MLNEWPAPHVGAGWVRGSETVDEAARFGETDRVFRLASLTKPLFSFALLVAIEEGSLHLDELHDVTPLLGADWSGEPRSATVRQLLSHSSGLGPTPAGPHVAPETRRVYSNLGFDILGDLLAAATGFTPADYLAEAVLAPLGMTSTALNGSPAFAASSTVNDLMLFCDEIRSPTLVTASSMEVALSPQFPGRSGVLPGYGRQDPNSWGLGFELRGLKSPHWTGEGQHPRTAGHFGQAGSFFWIDQHTRAACVVLTDHDFGPWALERWADFNEALRIQLLR